MSKQNQSDSNDSSKILEMEFYIGGWKRHKKLVLENDEISFPAPDAFSFQEFPGIIIPTSSELTEFSKNLDDLNVWDWKEHYNNSHIMDGVQWGLTIITDSKELNSGGSNDCLLYTSDAAEELDGVDLGGRRIIRKKIGTY